MFTHNRSFAGARIALILALVIGLIGVTPAGAGGAVLASEDSALSIYIQTPSTPVHINSGESKLVPFSVAAAENFSGTITSRTYQFFTQYDIPISGPFGPFPVSIEIDLAETAGWNELVYLPKAVADKARSTKDYAIILKTTFTGRLPSGEGFSADSSLLLLLPPDNFSKVSPADGALVPPNGLSLQWNASVGAVDYEYCFDTIDNNSCDTDWTGTYWLGTYETNAALQNLPPGTTFYWQVRANNISGTTYANSGVWWEFTTTLPSTPTSTRTPTKTPKGASPTPTITLTSTPITPTATHSVTPHPPTVTFTPSLTATPTHTPSQTLTALPSTITRTATNTPKGPRTNTPTPTQTVTPHPPTVTFTPSLTTTATYTPTQTLTALPSTVTRTATNTPKGPRTNTPTVTFTPSPTFTATSVVGQLPTVSKSFSPGTIWGGGTSRLTITIRNNDLTTSLTQASLTDNLPANVFLASPVSPTLSSCGAGATLTAVSGGTSVTLTNGTIAPNSTCTIQVNVTSNVQGAYDNTIPANALQNQQNLTNTFPATARLTVDLIGIAKGFSPSTIAAGGISTLTITLQNPAGTPYTGVNVTDNLPSPLTVAGAPTTTCGGTVSSTLTSVTLTGGTIPAGSPAAPGTCTISVLVSAPAGTPSGTLQNTIPAGALTTAQGVGNPRPANANITVAGSGMTGAKTFSPSSITAGGNSRLRIEVTAPGDTDLTNFSLTDNLPAGVTVSNSSPATATGCGVAAVVTVPTGATSISLTSGLILAGQTCRIDVWVTSSVTGTHTNIIAPANITNDQNRTTAGSFVANLNVTGAGNLAIDIVKAFNPLLVSGGASSTMSIQLINPGTVNLTGIAFTDTMPIEMILANPVNPNVGTCGGTLTGTSGSNSFSFSGGSLPAGGNCTLTLNATITVIGNRTNTIPVGAVTTNEGATNPNSTDATLTNLGGAIISKSFAPNPIAAGSSSILTITITNSGTITLTGMGLADNLPAGLVVAGAPAPVNNCGGTLTALKGASIVRLTNGVLAGNSSCTIVVSVTGSAAGDYLNTIPAGALITDPAVNVTNLAPATASLTITGNPGGGAAVIPR